MHPFEFTSAISFTCADPQSSIVFYPAENNRFHWCGRALDKIGHYLVVQKDVLYLELEWNYGRTQTYLIESLDGSNDNLRNFVLKDFKRNCSYTFSK